MLFIGLNQARSLQDEPWHLAQRHTPQTYWDYWRWLNRRAWYAQYYSPRVRLAAAALGVEIPRERDQQQEFATTKMVFVELCPYSSKRYSFADADLLALSEEDHGFRTAAQVRRILIGQGRPALVMVSGGQALTVLEHHDQDQLRLGEPLTYQSVSRPDKRLWHREGHFISGAE